PKVTARPTIAPKRPGGGHFTNGSRIAATAANRSASSRNGGICASPAFTATKLAPHTTVTSRRPAVWCQVKDAGTGVPARVSAGIRQAGKRLPLLLKLEPAQLGRLELRPGGLEAPRRPVEGVGVPAVQRGIGKPSLQLRDLAGEGFDPRGQAIELPLLLVAEAGRLPVSARRGRARRILRSRLGRRRCRIGRALPPIIGV